MNPLILAAHAHASGLSGLGADIFGGGGSSIADAFGGNIYRTQTGTGHSTRDFWGNIFTQSAGLVRDLFGNRGQQQQGPQGGAQLTVEQLAMLQAQQEALAKKDSEGMGIKFTDEGLKIGKTTISYPLMVLGGVAFWMIQSPGFQRRR